MAPEMPNSSELLQLPPIQKGASLLIAYQLQNRPVLLIGGGNVASGRLFFLLESGAKVTLVSPPPLDPSISARIKTHPDDITWYPRQYLGRDDSILVTDFAMVLTAIDNNELSRTVCSMAREAHVPVNVADVPPECDFYFGAQFRKGPLQVMVSTQGMGPKIGATVRDRLKEVLPDNVEEAIEGIGQLRKDLRERAPGVGGDLGKRRMEWMIGICDKWSLGEMTVLANEDIRKQVLDRGWDKGKIVGPEDVGAGSGSTGSSMSSRNKTSRLAWMGKEGTLNGLLAGIAIGVFGMSIWNKYIR